MAILYNISFDTVNCECCKDDSQCRINEDITKGLQNTKGVLDMQTKRRCISKEIKSIQRRKIKTKETRN
jgi:DNA polymerase elongation subunit (family B)